MSSIFKNIIIFVVLLALLGGGYFFYFKDKQNPDPAATLTSTNTGSAPGALGDSKASGTAISSDTQGLLSLLLNVKTIKLNDEIFRSASFATLKDSTITLVQEGNEGRPNPFAPIGSDPVVVSNIPEIQTIDASMINLDLSNDSLNDLVNSLPAVNASISATSVAPATTNTPTDVSNIKVNPIKKN